MTATPGARHPALRVPVPGDGAGLGDPGSVRHTADGVPLLVARPDRLLAAAGAAATAPLDRLPAGDRAAVARYLPELARPSRLRTAVADVLRDHAPPGAGLGVEVGCAVGVDTRALRAVAAEVVAFDHAVGMVRVAAQQLSGRKVPVPVRREGHRYDHEQLRLPAAPGVTVVVGDALDPPLRPAVADVVVCANLLDSIRDPLNLLGQLDAVLAPGGVLVLTSPFSWHDTITPPELQLGGGTDPVFGGRPSQRVLVELLTGQLPVLSHLAHDVLAQHDVPWLVRSDERTSTTHLVHVLVTRKR